MSVKKICFCPQFLRRRRDAELTPMLRQRREADQEADGSALYYAPITYSNFGYAGLGYPYILRRKRDVEQMAAATDFSTSRYYRRQFINRNAYSSLRYSFF